MYIPPFSFFFFLFLLCRANPKRFACLHIRGAASRGDRPGRLARRLFLFFFSFLAPTYAQADGEVRVVGAPMPHSWRKTVTRLADDGATPALFTFFFPLFFLLFPPFFADDLCFVFCTGGKCASFPESLRPLDFRGWCSWINWVPPLFSPLFSLSPFSLHGGSEATRQIQGARTSFGCLRNSLAKRGGAV